VINADSVIFFLEVIPMLTRIQNDWTRILDEIKNDQDLSNVSFNTWLVPLKPIDFDGHTLTVLYPEGNSFTISIIENKYRFLLQNAINVISGVKCNIVFTIEELTAKPERQREKSSPQTLAKLNPKYTFDSFVVGSNNKMAHAASLAVAESPATSYNPLFIYGATGLGKTHLMQAIAHFILQQNPSAKVIYVSSENFTTELIDAIRNKNNISTTEFREKYRNIDVLLIDDIQFIINKESTQEEVFHTFNALYEAKKQIIFSSDRPPKDLVTLEDRLRSRFEQGLTVSIDSPDYETRMAILRKKEELEGYNIDNEVIKYIATNIKSNIRELEGALLKVDSYARLNNRELTLTLAEEALRDNISNTQDREITPQRVIETVSDHFNLNPSDLMSEKRSKEYAYPRQIAMYLCCVMTNESLTTIARCIGKKDHTTIIHGRDKISKDLPENESLKKTIDILKKKLSPGS